MKPLNTLEFVGASLTIIGSFLPWERSGGFLDLFINGVRVDLASFKFWVTGIHRFPVYDYGGGFVILLTSVIVLLAIQPPRFIKNPILWNLIVSAVLMTSSMFFVGRGLIHVYEYGSSIEQPTLRMGLSCVALGSALLLWRAIMTYRQVAYHKNKSAI